MELMTQVEVKTYNDDSTKVGRAEIEEYCCKILTQ